MSENTDDIVLSVTYQGMTVKVWFDRLTFDRPYFRHEIAIDDPEGEPKVLSADNTLALGTGELNLPAALVTLLGFLDAWREGLDGRYGEPGGELDDLFPVSPLYESTQGELAMWIGDVRSMLDNGD